MDYLYLPYLTPEESLVTAFDRMFQTDSRAMILHRSKSYTLYTNEEVATALTETNKETCSQLSSEEAIPVVDLTGQLSGAIGPSYNWFNARSMFKAIFEQQFAFHNMDYGILFPPFPPRPGSMILVITRQELKKDEILDRNKVCVCSGMSKHKAYGKNTGDLCDVDPPETYKCT